MEAKFIGMINRAAAILKDGGVIIYPTETIYGLGGNAFDEGAVRKVFRIKGRNEGKSLIVLVKDFEMADQLADLGNYRELLKKYWPGPLTGVFKSKSKEGTVALRISPHPFVQKLFKSINFPIISTSANKSGDRSCQAIDEVKVSLGIQFQLIDFVVDFGPLPPSAPSTVVDFTTEKPKVLRPGAVEFRL